MGGITVQQGITGGANKALSNLASVAINTALLPDGDLLNIGSESFTWDSIFVKNIIQQGTNTAKTTIKQVSTELTGLTGASVTASNLIPAGSFIIGITARVTTTITGATTFDIGDGVDVDRWGAAIILPVGTTVDITDYTVAGFGQFATANDIVLTANVANFTAGAIRLTVHYIDLTAATS